MNEAENTPKRKYLKITMSSFQNASRDKRELSVAREQGYEAVVLGIPDQHG